MRRPRLAMLSILAVVVLAVLAGVSVGPAQETFPSRPITFVVGFAPGGGADVLGRALADAAKTTLPRPLVVENRPGAGGTNAAAYAIGRPADGYTLLFGHAGSTILTPTIGNTPNLKWDAFEPVARVQGEEEFLFLRPGAQWKTIDEVAAFAKQNPGKFRVGGSAVGGIDSFVILTWEKVAGLDVTYVPFEGGGPATLCFLGGNVDMLVGNVSDSVANLEAKRMFPVAVASEKRSPIYPDVPDAQGEGLGRRAGAVAGGPRPQGHAAGPDQGAGRRLPEGARHRQLEGLPGAHPVGRPVPGPGRVPRLPGRGGEALRPAHRRAGAAEEVEAGSGPDFDFGSKVKVGV